MRTERVAVLLLGLSCLACVAGSAWAQIRVDGATEVSRIRFRLDADPPLSEQRLREVVLLRERGRWDGVRTALGWLWLVPEPEPRLFSPIELQRDVVRIRRLHAESGYPKAAVRYELTRDDRRNRVEIEFVVQAGPPLVVREVEVAPVDTLAALPVPPKERRSWERFVQSVAELRGQPARTAEVARVQREAQVWWQDRGHPFAVAAAGLDVDSARFEARVRVRIDPGPSARVADVRIEGTSALHADAVARELPFRAGDSFSARELTEGQRQAQGLEIVRLALVDVPPEQARDSLVTVRIRITEAEPRLVSGELGYVSDGGVASEVRWSHRNLDHRALGLTVSAVAQTGWLSLVDNPDKRYRGSVTLQKPYVFDRRLSLLLTPFVEHRDDQTDRSLRYGVDLTALRQDAPLRSIALKYGISQKNIWEYRFGDFSAGDIDLLTVLQQLAVINALGTTLTQSAFTLTSTMGGLDDPALPRQGFVLRPDVTVTAPQGWNSTQFFRLDLGAWGYLPLARRRSVLVGRVAAGRLFPFGKSIPGPAEDPAIEFLQFRDVAFTAGGDADVRGWENRLLGPKFPDVRVDISGDTTAVAGEYVPLGGLARVSSTLELQLPIPALGSKWDMHVFLDAGRVWTPDSRFHAGADRAGQEGWFFGTGAGIDRRTPVGRFRVGLGYKLNPSIQDLVDSSVLIEGIQAGTPLDQLPKDQGRRLQYYLSIGAGF